MDNSFYSLSSLIIIISINIVMFELLHVFKQRSDMDARSILASFEFEFDVFDAFGNFVLSLYLIILVR